MHCSSPPSVSYVIEQFLLQSGTITALGTCIREDIMSGVKISKVPI